MATFPGVSGCQERGIKFTELGIVPPSLHVLFIFNFFEGIEVALQHYLK